jgi:tripeptidyl-peptidase-1
VPVWYAYLIVGSVVTGTLTPAAVTSVGSTVGLPEVAVNFSSGGFSNYFPRPWYQDRVVPRYLDTLPASFPGVFNRSGRGFPDVATQGVNFGIINGGVAELVNGTSASSPTFASIVALVNDRLAQLGKKPLGFLNPFLYLAAGPAGVFNDVTSGKNVGPYCDQSAVAFSAQKGWDPATGFGTPDYPKLLLAAGVKSLF